MSDLAPRRASERDSGSPRSGTPRAGAGASPLRARYLLTALALLAAVATVVPVRDALAIWRAPAGAAPCTAGPALVMGAAQYDGRPSPAFARRLDGALDLYRRGCAGRIVVSGGKQQGDRFSEGQAGVAYLAARGVPAADLTGETRASTSWENVRNSLPALGAPDAEAPLVIVTDDLHAHRSAWLARRAGIEPDAVAVAPVPTRSAGLERLRYAARELLIMTAYHLGVLR